MDEELHFIKVLLQILRNCFNRNKINSIVQAEEFHTFTRIIELILFVIYH